MNRIRTVTRQRMAPASIAPEVKLTYLMNFIEISIPLVQDKDPENPDPTTDTGGTDDGATS